MFSRKANGNGTLKLQRTGRIQQVEVTGYRSTRVLVTHLHSSYESMNLSSYSQVLCTP